VLDAEDRMQVVVVLDDHSRPQLRCWNCHSKILLNDWIFAGWPRPGRGSEGKLLFYLNP
jgi:hypothetical protein